MKIEGVEEDNLEKLKKQLRSIPEENIKLSNHAEYMLKVREGLQSESMREEILKTVQNPTNLVFSYQEKGKRGDIKHKLHFEKSSTRTFILPVIFKDNNKSLYILTYIMRYRKWKSFIKRKYRRQ